MIARPWREPKEPAAVGYDAAAMRWSRRWPVVESGGLVLLAISLSVSPAWLSHHHALYESDLVAHDHHDGAVMVLSTESCTARHLHPAHPIAHDACVACLAAAARVPSLAGGGSGELTLRHTSRTSADVFRSVVRRPLGSPPGRAPPTT